MIEERRKLFVPLCIVVSDDNEQIKKEICLKDLKSDTEIMSYIDIASRLGMVTQPGLIS